MSGNEETPNTDLDETFKRLRRISFHTLVERLKVYWIDQEVINILAENNNWEDWSGQLDPGGWTRAEFTEECRKQYALGNFSKDQYLEKIGLK